MNDGNDLRFLANKAGAQKIPQTLIDIERLARYLSISKGTLYNWVYLRRIPFIKVGRCVRFDLQEVLDRLASTTMESAGKR